jgi:hypothetical protein
VGGGKEMLTFGISPQEKEFEMLTKAVRCWYSHYKVSPDDQGNDLLCSSALELFNNGCRTQEELTTHLITMFNGASSLAINAPTSSSSH